MKLNIPIFIDEEGNVVEDRFNIDKNYVFIIKKSSLLKKAINFFADSFISENNETKLKILEKELMYYLKEQKEENSLDLKYIETKTIEEVEWEPPAPYDFTKHNLKKKEEKEDRFFEMFGYNDEVAEKEENEKQKQIEKQAKKNKDKNIPVAVPAFVEIIQEELNDDDNKKIIDLKSKGFTFISNCFGRVYACLYTIATFKGKDNLDLILLKISNSYLLTNLYYLDKLKQINDSSCYIKEVK